MTCLKNEKNTLEKHEYLEEFAMLVVIKECEYGQLQTETAVHAKYLAQIDILNGVRGGELFGAIVCDVCVPDHLKADFAEMPPIF